MATGQSTESPRSAPGDLRSISWWASAVVGLLVGWTLVWMRTQRNFFFVGAAILAAVIIVVGVRTIRRRARYPQCMDARTSWAYGFWALFLMVLAGPAQLVFVSNHIDQLSLKSMIVSVGFCFGIHELDRALVKSANAQRRD